MCRKSNKRPCDNGPEVDSIKTDLTEIDADVVNWMGLVQFRDQGELISIEH